MIQNREIKKLKGKSKIDLVFRKGKAIRFGSLILHYMNKNDDFQSLELGVGVSKKFILLATKRNRIKRQIYGEIQKQKLVVLTLLPDGLYMILFNEKHTIDSESILKDLKGLFEHFTV